MQKIKFNPKRLLSLVLTLCMMATLITALPIMAQAAFYTQPSFYVAYDGTGVITYNFSGKPDSDIYQGSLVRVDDEQWGSDFLIFDGDIRINGTFINVTRDIIVNGT